MVGIINESRKKMISNFFIGVSTKNSKIVARSIVDLGGLLCGEVLFISNLILLVPSLDINTLSPLLLVITLASLPSQSFIFFAKSSTLLGTVLRVPSLQGL